MRSGSELFKHELQDVYDAEHRLYDALDEMSRQVKDDELAEGFREHRQQTREQIRRLESVFESMDEKPKRTACVGVEGIIEEYKRFVKKERPQGDVLNAFATGAGLKSEHYEMAAYGSLITMARNSGMDDAARLLQQNLREEEQTAEKLEVMGEMFAQRLGGNGSRGGVVRQGAMVALGAAEMARERAGDVVSDLSDYASRIIDDAEEHGRERLDERGRQRLERPAPRRTAAKRKAPSRAAAARGGRKTATATKRKTATSRTRTAPKKGTARTRSTAPARKRTTAKSGKTAARSSRGGTRTRARTTRSR